MKSDGFAAAALAEFWLGADIVNRARLKAVQLPAQALHERTFRPRRRARPRSDDLASRTRTTTSTRSNRFRGQGAIKRPWGLFMNRPKGRQVLDCASPLALFDLVRGRKSGSGLPQSKTLSRRRTPLARAIGVTGNVCKVFAKKRGATPVRLREC